LEPCTRIPNDSGPGARAPDALTTITLAMKSSNAIF
jgi:hypothetical protein